MQSLGCVLYALMYFKSPFDAVYERGDSVNLAVISGNVFFPEETPFEQVCTVLYMVTVFSFFGSFQELHELVLFMLKVNPAERPFIDDVIDKFIVYNRKTTDSVLSVRA